MNVIAAALGRQLSRPRGIPGRMVAHAMRFANQRSNRQLIDALGITDGDSVLDLGCGAGDAISALVDAAGTGTVQGLDHAPDIIALATRRHPGVTFHLASFYALPFANASIDRVLAANVAYFWHDESRVITEIRRVLRPGGRLAIYVTKPSALRRAGLASTGTHRLYSAESLANLLGPKSIVYTVDAGFGVCGLVATLDG